MKPPDLSELQDLYRHALAASWQAQPSDLPADQCIEDLFAGGDGFRKLHNDHKDNLEVPVRPEDSRSSDDQHQKNQGHCRVHSDSSQATIRAHGKGSPMKIAHKQIRNRAGSNTTNVLQEGDNSSDTSRGKTATRNAHLVDEFDQREDLVAWRLPGPIETT